MKGVVDSMGRVVIPKALRDELGLTPGSPVDLSRFGGGVHLEPESRTARLEQEGDRMVIVSETVVDDDLLFALIDAGRR